MTQTGSDQSGIETGHVSMFRRIGITHLLALAVGDRGIVSVQNPVRLARHSEPQPDFAVLKPRGDYKTMLPR